MQLNLTAVIVLYRCRAQDSVAYQTLLAAQLAAANLLQLHIVLYDNTPGAQDAGELQADVEYVAADANRGLATGYNLALQRAVANGSRWLLTLDQDTSLPENFLQTMGPLAVEVDADDVIAAIVPQIVGSGRILSPYWFRAGAVAVWFAAGFHGVPGQKTFAFNSAALLRTAALQQAGGYDPWFWLDDSDHFMFQRLHRLGKRVLVAGEVRVEHDFSMMDLRNRVSVARYRNVLLAETAFWDLEMNWLAGMARLARLVVRLVKHLRRNDPVELRRETVEFLKRRLLWSRRRRLRAWQRETLERFPDLPPFTR